MKPKSTVTDQGDLFRSQLDQILNRRHPLHRLADSIDWSVFDKDFGKVYVENVGLHYLKHAFNESDESVVDRLVAFQRANQVRRNRMDSPGSDIGTPASTRLKQI